MEPKVPAGGISRLGKTAFAMQFASSSSGRSGTVWSLRGNYDLGF